MLLWQQRRDLVPLVKPGWHRLVDLLQLLKAAAPAQRTKRR